MGLFRQIKHVAQLRQGDTDIPVDRWQNRDLVPLPPGEQYITCKEVMMASADRWRLSLIQNGDNGEILTSSACGAQSSLQSMVGKRQPLCSPSVSMSGRQCCAP